MDLKGNGADASGNEISCSDFAQAWSEVYIRELAFWSAVNLVANAVGKCEFKTFRASNEYKGKEYWLWNFSPNNNQNSSEFLHKLIGKLYRNNEALVIERAGHLLVADSFEKTSNAVREDVFSEIEVEDLEINTTFRAKDVLYFRLNHNNVYPMLQGLNGSYSRLIQASKDDFEWSSGRHGIMNIGAMKVGDPKWAESYQEVLDKLIKPYFNSANSVMPEFQGFTYREEGSSGGRAQRTTRDIRALIDDIYEITAKAFQIPAVLLKGEVEGTQDAVDSLLTFCIDPLCDHLQEEIVRKRYGYEEYIAGNFLKIVTTTIKHFDLFSNATSVDKLISSGAFSINDIRIAAGETPIGDDWADKHFITKNYTEIGELLELGGKAN